jgi:hypothetical protein
MAGGLLHEIGEFTLPRALRQSQLYQTLVEASLRFLIEQVGQVEGVYPSEEKLAEDFLIRRTAGNGIELIGVLAFRASPVWVLAALADASGAGKFLIAEIAKSLKEEGLLDPDTEFVTVNQMLDGLEGSASRVASTINAPPLDVATLRKEWQSVQRDLAKIPPKNLPTLDSLRRVWTGVTDEAARQNRTAFQVSAVMAMSAITHLPQKAHWISSSTRLAVGKTGSLAAAILLDHYSETLAEIQQEGFLPYTVRQFRPYLYGAASQFSPSRKSLTERLLKRGKGEDIEGTKDTLDKGQPNI